MPRTGSEKLAPASGGDVALVGLTELVMEKSTAEFVGGLIDGRVDRGSIHQSGSDLFP